MLDNAHYTTQYPIDSYAAGEAGSHLPVVCHVSGFSYSMDCAVKMAPLYDTACLLMENYMVSGFTTETEFLIISEKKV